MRILHEPKVIWISKPKTGSTSYRKLLDPLSDIRTFNSSVEWSNNHIKLPELKRKFHSKGWDFSKYYKIVPCRNPWNLLLSLYSYAKTDINGIRFWKNKKQYNPNQLMSFSDWISKPGYVDWFKRNHALKSYIMDGNSDLSDLVFAPDVDPSPFLKVINERCGTDFNADSIPRLNITNKSAELLDEVTKVYQTPFVDSMIHNVFGLEIEMFDYQNPFE